LYAFHFLRKAIFFFDVKFPFRFSPEHFSRSFSVDANICISNPSFLYSLVTYTIRQQKSVDAYFVAISKLGREIKEVAGLSKQKALAA